MTFEINGRFIHSGFPYGLHFDNGQISSVGWWDVIDLGVDPFGEIKIENNEFTIHQSILSSDTVSGYVSGITDLGHLVQVPEPGSLALLATGLLGFAFRRRFS